MALNASMVDSTANGMVGLSIEIAPRLLGASLDDESICLTQPLTSCRDHQSRSVKGQKQCLACLYLSCTTTTIVA